MLHVINGKIPIGLVVIEFRVIDKWLRYLNARDKLFMMNLLHHEGLKAEYITSAKELSMKFSFPESMIKASLASLVKQGVLWRRRIDTTSFCYSFTKYAILKNVFRTSSFYAGGKGVDPLSVHCLYPAIKRESSVDGKWIDAINSLSYAGRLVLFWMISKSSSAGIVAPGTKTLAKFSGVGVDGVRNQLQRLTSLGVITKLSSGFTGKYLYGVTSSRYGLLFSEEGKRLVHHSNLLLERYQSGCAYKESVDSIIMQKMEGASSLIQRALIEIRTDLLKPAIANYLLFNVSVHCIQHPEINLYLETLCPLSEAYQKSLSEEFKVDGPRIKTELYVVIGEVIRAIKSDFDAQLTFSNKW